MVFLYLNRRCRFRYIKVTFTITALSLILFITKFYLIKDQENGIEINPFSVFYFFGFIPMTGFILGVTYVQINLILSGLTNKELDSIHHFQRLFMDGKLIKNNNIKWSTVEKNFPLARKQIIPIREKLFNLLHFLIRSTEESLIFKESTE